MRVLMFGWEFPPFVSGGLGVASEGLVRGLASVGAEVVLVLPRYRPSAVEAGGPPARFRVVDAGALEDRRRDTPHPALTVELRRVTTRLRPYVTESIYAAETASTSTSAPGRLSGGYGPDLASEVMRYAALSAAIARNERFDVIHAHDWLTFLAGLEARRVSGRPLAVHVHATEFDRAGGDGDRFVSDVERIGMTLANRVIAVSRYTARQVESRYGIPAERVRVVHNAIDPAPPPGERESGERAPLVLFAGRITRQKGPEQFVEAAARVARELPAVRFAVAGSGDGAGPMRERVEALGLTSHFRFTGFLEPAELEELYRRADVYVMPSVSEPFGLTALEALRHGTPVIVSRDAGVSEVVANVLRFRTGDVQDLASRILSVLIYPPLSRELSARGRADVGRLSWAASARQCMELYREMLLAG